MSVLIISILIILTITGTFMGSGGGAIPFCTKKVGKSFGINLGIMTEFEEGAVHYGINIGLFNRNWAGKVVGLDLGLWSISDDESPKKIIEGVQISLINESIIKGIQFGIFNISQRKQDDSRRSFIINFDFRKITN